MSLHSDARHMFLLMWKFYQKYPTISKETNSEIRAQFLGSWTRLLSSIHYFLTLNIRAVSSQLPRLSGNQDLKKIFASGNQQLKNILKVITKARNSYSFFDVLQSLYLYLELYEGQEAYRKGTKSYRKILSKWNNKKYDILKKF